MFGAVRRTIFLQRREALDHSSSQFRIRRNLPERSLPVGLGHDRKRLPVARVIRAENDAVPGNFYPRINRPRNRARVNISRMRSDATDGGDAIIFRPCSVAANVAQQFLGTPWIKSASHSGSA